MATGSAERCRPKQRYLVTWLRAKETPGCRTHGLVCQVGGARCENITTSAMFAPASIELTK
jgi:hypothetical protein